MAEKRVVKGKVSSKRRSGSAPTSNPKANLSLEDIIATLQALGYKITPASSEEDQERQEKSLEKLGVKVAKKEVIKEPTGPLVLVLRCRHILSGREYGPGRVEIDRSEVGLYNTLAQQDQLATREFYNRGEGYETYHLIRPGAKGFGKVQISEEAMFNLDGLGSSVRVGRGDSPGYNPDTYYANRSF